MGGSQIVDVERTDHHDEPPAAHPHANPDPTDTGNDHDAALDVDGAARGDVHNGRGQRSDDDNAGVGYDPARYRYDNANRIIGPDEHIHFAGAVNPVPPVSSGAVYPTPPVSSGAVNSTPASAPAP